MGGIGQFRGAEGSGASELITRFAPLNATYEICAPRSDVIWLLIKAGGQANCRAIRQEKTLPQDIAIDNPQWIAVPAGVLKGQVIGLIFVPAQIMQAFFGRRDFRRGKPPERGAQQRGSIALPFGLARA